MWSLYSLTNGEVGFIESVRSLVCIEGERKEISKECVTIHRGDELILAVRLPKGAIPSLYFQNESNAPILGEVFDNLEMDDIPFDDESKRKIFFKKNAE